MELIQVTTVDINDKNWEVDYDKMQLTADKTIFKVGSWSRLQSVQ